jgi:hypothetical protein
MGMTIGDTNIDLHTKIHMWHNDLTLLEQDDGGSLTTELMSRFEDHFY